MTAQTEIKNLWMTAAAGVYPNSFEAERGFARVSAAIAEADRRKRIEAERERAARRAEARATEYRGLTAAAPTCGRCFTNHRGEC